MLVGHVDFCVWFQELFRARSAVRTRTFPILKMFRDERAVLTFHDGGVEFTYAICANSLGAVDVPKPPRSANRTKSLL